MHTQNGQLKIQTFCWTDDTRSKNFSVSHLFKICYVKSGSLLWEIGDTVYKAHAGDIAVLNNNEHRRFKKIYGGEPFSLTIIEFEPRFLFTSVFLPLFLNRPSSFKHIISAGGTVEIEALLREMGEENSARKPYFEEVIAAKLMNLVALIARITKLPVKNGCRMSEQMYDVLDYIGAHYTEDITLSQLAEIAHMSQGGFSKAFLRSNGIGVMQYIIRKRVAKAIYLLEHTNESVLNIAVECGFNNGASFYQAFKKNTGRTPKSFRAAFSSEADKMHTEP